jgi:FHS family L-fucose permease-like MFS transporter
LTTLFFMWGSLTSLNDVLIPYAQHVFNLSLAKSMLIQTAFFLAYFVFSIPSSKIIDWIGYKRAIIVGLLTMVIACLGFYPAAKIPSFPFFLAAPDCAGNEGLRFFRWRRIRTSPYWENRKTHPSRLVLTQAFNSLGTAVFPFVGARVILGTTARLSRRARRSRYYLHYPAVCVFLCCGVVPAGGRLCHVETP